MVRIAMVRQTRVWARHTFLLPTWPPELDFGRHGINPFFEINSRLSFNTIHGYIYIFMALVMAAQ